jgi:NTE family protein
VCEIGHVVDTSAPSFFQSLSDDEVAELLGPLVRCTFEAGSVVLAEGDSPTEMHVIISGVCGVFVTGPAGSEVQIGQFGPGATVGEMALFAGQSESINVAAATVRALTALEAVVLDAPSTYAIAAMYPQILHNIGAILSHRLTRSYKHALAEHGRVTVLLDHGAPLLLAYALAASIAWHTRGSTVLVVVGDSHPADLEALAARPGGGARLMLVPPTGEFAEPALGGTIEELSHHHKHVLLLMKRPGDDESPMVPGLRVRTVRLAGPSGLFDGDGPAGGRRHCGAVRAWAGDVRPTRWLRPDADGVMHVPALDPSDEVALRDGLLPSTTPAGRALGWLARDLAGLKVGISLGAGSVRGYAHYGVLRYFERIGLDFDYVTGSSIGAIIASTYALGQSADEAARVMEETSVRAFKLTVPVHSLLSNAGIAANFRDVSGDTRIEDLDVPLGLVAADLSTGREVVLKRGLLRVAALASMAIPGVYPPVRIGEHILVDGGVVNPVPISVACAMGADVVIAVKLGRAARESLTDLEAVEQKGGKLPSLVQNITKSIDAMQRRIGSAAVVAATVVIEPSFAGTPSAGLQSFAKGRPYIAPGEVAAEAALPEIAATLPWLR